MMNEDLSRRSFVKGAGVTSAAVMAAAFAPAIASASAGASASSSAGSASGSASESASKSASASASASGSASASASASAAASASASGSASAPELPEDAYDENGICTLTRAQYFEAVKPAIADSDIASSEDYDVVIVGAGNGGLVAAVSAMDLGASVCVVEQNASYVTWAGECGAWNSQVENDDFGVHYTDEELQSVANDMCRYASYGNDQRLVETFIKNSGRTMDWMCEKLAPKNISFTVETDMKDTIYQNLPSQHCAYVKGTLTDLGPNQLGAQISNPAYEELLNEGGATIEYNTKAKILVQDADGKVTGVIVEAEDGTYKQINAAKGVFLSTGGFSGNVDLMDVLGVQHHRIAVNNLGGDGRNGDGMKMAVWAGAAINKDYGDAVMSFDRGACALDHHVGPEYGVTLDDIYWPGSQPFLHVNVAGERYANEDGPYDFMSHAAQYQNGHIWFEIFDSSYWEDVQAFHTTICSRVVATPGAQDSEVLPGIYPVTSGDDYYNVFMKNSIDAGRLIEADTVEDLAKQLGLPADTLQATIDRYNEVCDAGFDEDFGKQASRLSKVDTAPFYGIALGSWMLCSIDGVRVDPANFHAIKDDGTDIEGLYILGNDMGGFFKNTYPEFYAGTAMGKTCCFARLATLFALTGSIYEQ